MEKMSLLSSMDTRDLQRLSSSFDSVYLGNVLILNYSSIAAIDLLHMLAYP